MLLLLECLLCFSQSLSSGLLNSLVNRGLVRLGLGTVLVVDLLVLCHLLFELSQLRLKSGLLEDLGFLIGVDHLGGDQFIKRFAWVALQHSIQLRGIGLEIRCAVRIGQSKLCASLNTYNLFGNVSDVPVGKKKRIRGCGLEQTAVD